MTAARPAISDCFVVGGGGSGSGGGGGRGGGGGGGGGGDGKGQMMVASVTALTTVSSCDTNRRSRSCSSYGRSSIRS